MRKRKTNKTNQNASKSVHKNKNISPLSIFLLCFAIFVTFITFMAHQGYQITIISGNSMYPNLRNGELTFSYPQDEYHVNDVVQIDAKQIDPRYNKNESRYVKRIIAKEGQTVSFDGKDLFVNGIKQKQDYIDQETKKSTYAQSFLPDSDSLYVWNLKTLSNRLYNQNDYYYNRYSVNKMTVPNDMFFVLGDNRSVSNDSRYYGFVPKTAIISKVHTIPFVSIGSDKNARAVNN